MIKIRLQRHGARHSPFYRMVVTPSTTRRDGKFIEVLGTYNPQAHLRSEELNLKMERIDHWLGVGAQPTDTARSLIRQSRLSPEQWLEKSEREASNRLKRAQKGNVSPAMEEAKLEEKSEDSAPVKEAKAPAEADTKVEDKSPETKSEESAPVKEEKTEAKAPAEADTKVEEKAPETKSEESASIKEKGKTEDKGSAKEEENLKEKPAADEKSKEVAGKDEPKAKKSEEDSKEA
jgi:small subunit ribosomal protein S16